jgi:hypothetical protein
MQHLQKSSHTSIDKWINNNEINLEDSNDFWNN